MQQRRKYSEEFKREAVALANQPDVTLSQVARELCINGHILGLWRRALEAEGAQAFPGQGHTCLINLSISGIGVGNN